MKEKASSLNLLKISTILASVSDKTGLVEFLKPLSKNGVKIISTGGTAKALKEAGIEVQLVEELTGFPELLDGRVKTLHPKIHAGILADKRNKKHLEELKKNNIPAIDLVICNLYPFRETISKNPSINEAIENIDIGGVALLRAAAKNYESVAVISSPEQYAMVSEELKKNKNCIGLELRKKLALKAFEFTSVYDSGISEYLREKFLAEQSGKFPEFLSFGFEKVSETRYGENPHQKAAVYADYLRKKGSTIEAKQLAGKEMSFNNWNDLNSAIELAKEFRNPACVIVKHANACGVSEAKEISLAFAEALECDKVSAFGGIIALNRECNFETAKQITSFFNELVVAPNYSNDALNELKSKKNLRVMLLPSLGKDLSLKEFDFKKISGGLLVQEKDLHELSGKEEKNSAEFNVVTKKQPSKEEINSLLFAFKVVKHEKSNAIVLVQGTKTVGIGMGQTNRVDAAEQAIKRAGANAKNSVLASDAFFPFADSIELASKAGIKAIIQPGGSINDKQVIEAADNAGIAMVFTGIRHFRH